MTIVRTILAFLAGALGLVVTLAVGLVSLPIWLVSSLTVRVASLLEPRAMAHGDVIEYDPDLGWKGKPNQQGYVRDENGDPHRVTTDAEGWRGSGRLDDAQVVAMGDSFAFGDGIGDDDFFASRGDGVTIKAVGAPGYSMVQGLMLMERLAPRLKGKTVAWLVYQGNDLADNLKPEMDGYRAPFLRHDGSGWTISRDHVSPERWRFQTRLKAHELLMEIGVGSHLSRRAFQAFEHLVDQARGVLDRAGAHLVVVSVPDLSALSQRRFREAVKSRPDLADWDPDLPDREMSAICRRLGVSFEALAARLTTADYRENDVHWNESGNERVARLLSRLHAESERSGDASRATDRTRAVG